MPSDSTQQFMSAYNAVRPQRRQTAAQPRPTPAAQSPAPPPDAAGEDPYENTVVVGNATQEENRQTGERLLPHRQRDDVDQLVDTLTGRISLTPQPPAAPAHTGFTQSLSAPTPAHSGRCACRGTACPQRLHAEPRCRPGGAEHLCLCQ